MVEPEADWVVDPVRGRDKVTLWYDPQRGRVGLGAAKKGEPAAYPVRSAGPRSSQGLVSGRRLLVIDVVSE